MNLAIHKCIRCVGGATVAVALLHRTSHPAHLLAQGCSLPTDPSRYVGHIVVIMMENRSFDHLAGWTTGTPPLRTYYVDPTNLNSQHCDTYALNRPVSNPPPPPACVPGFPLPSYVGTANSMDPAHDIGDMGRAFNGGGNDGWLKNGVTDSSLYAIGYYDQDPTNLTFLYKLLTNTATNVGQSVLLNQYFASMLTSTNPNRIYEHTGTTDRYANVPCQTDNVTVMCDASNPQVSQMKTIWDLLADRGVTAGLYEGTCCEWLQTYWPGLVGTVFKGHEFEFDRDAGSGMLPTVTFLDAHSSHRDHFVQPIVITRSSDRDRSEATLGTSIL